MAIPKNTTQQFIKKSRQKWGNRFGYQKTRYINTRTPVILWCKKHQSYFEQTPKSHFATKHECCPICYSLIAGFYQNQWRYRPSLKRKGPSAPYLIDLVFRLPHE
ncbi:hypothetical protein GCM10007938_06970 [Vibrio zhanjiangensis]|uniref:Uncharacterized protein n=1 Tax=Vibrio zhanjiangensis TaxID=1046128 RepID=A0ABQ6EWG1_9VIBR|nr:hypothetical protein GCM10007938_06970 [Vibrio zhanjiangensis]